MVVESTSLDYQNKRYQARFVPEGCSSYARNHYLYADIRIKHDDYYDSKDFFERNE